MTLSKEEVLDSIAQMSVMDIVELVQAMEEKFGVSAAAAAPAAAASAGGGDAADEAVQDAFNVMLLTVGEKKVNVIKTVRSITGLGLKEAKALVDKAAEGQASAIKEGVAKADAEDMQKQLEEAGATTEIK